MGNSILILFMEEEKYCTVYVQYRWNIVTFDISNIKLMSLSLNSHTMQACSCGIISFTPDGSPTGEMRKREKARKLGEHPSTQEDPSRQKGTDPQRHPFGNECGPLVRG